MVRGRFIALSSLKMETLCLCIFPVGGNLAPYLSPSNQRPLVWFGFLSILGAMCFVGYKNGTWNLPSYLSRWWIQHKHSKENPRGYLISVQGELCMGKTSQEASWGELGGVSCALNVGRFWSRRKKLPGLSLVVRGVPETDISILCSISLPLQGHPQFLLTCHQ